MPSRVLLDSNVLVRLIDEDSVIRTAINRFDEAAIPSIVMGELYYGAFRSGRRDENLSRIEKVAGERVVLAPGIITARIYGELKADLASRGLPIPDNDTWIAALAIEHDATLLSRDAHFMRVQGLQLESP